MKIIFNNEKIDKELNPNWKEEWEDGTALHESVFEADTEIIIDKVPEGIALIDNKRNNLISEFVYGKETDISSVNLSKFSKRSEFATAVLGDTIYVIGGKNEAGVVLGDIWSSSDEGKNWEKIVIDGAGFGQLYGHKAIGFNGRLLILGGVRASGVFNYQVLYSYDSKNWLELKRDPEFGWRTGFSLFIFDEKILLAGGFGTDGKELFDIWSSSSGRDWSEFKIEKEIEPKSFSQTVVHNDELVLIGGNKDVGISGDIQTTKDGISWGGLLRKLEWGNERTPLVIKFGNDIYVFSNPPGTNSDKYNTVWKSNNNGQSFSVVKTYIPGDNGHDKFRYNSHLCVYRGKLFSIRYDPIKGRGFLPGFISSVASTGSFGDVKSSSTHDNRHNRKNFGLVAYKAGIYIMGGINKDDSLLNDMVYLEGTEAMNLKFVNLGNIDSPNWSAREKFGVIVFKDKIFVIGGEDSSGVLNDVYSYEKGVGWKKEKDNNNSYWSRRRGFLLQVYKDRMYLIGGYNKDGVVQNDVWSSEDGKIWTEDIFDIDFLKDREIASIGYKDANGKDNLLVFSGKEIDSTNENKVWSFLGRNSYETLSNLSMIPNLQGFQAVNVEVGAEKKEKIVIIGGKYADGTFPRGDSPAQGDLFSFNNEVGIIEKENNGFYSYSLTPVIQGKRTADFHHVSTIWKVVNFKAISFNGKIYILGGMGSSSLQLNEVGYLEFKNNGEISYQEYEYSGDDSIWDRRESFQAVVFNKNLYIMGGEAGLSRSRKYLDDIWFNDGSSKTWNKVNVVEPYWIGRSNFQAVVFNGKLYVMGGRKKAGNLSSFQDADGNLIPDRNGNLLSDVWSSEDGKTWIEENSNALWRPREGFTCEVYDEKLWLIGGQDKDGNRLNDIYYMDKDGTWNSLGLDLSISDFTASNLISLDKEEKLVVSGVINGERRVLVSTENDLIFQEKTGNTIGDVYKSSLFYFTHQIWLISETGSLWSSSNGLDWIKEDEREHIKNRKDFSLLSLYNKVLLIGGKINDAFYNDTRNLILFTTLRNKTNRGIRLSEIIVGEAFENDITVNASKGYKLNKPKYTATGRLIYDASYLPVRQYSASLAPMTRQEADKLMRLVGENNNRPVWIEWGRGTTSHNTEFENTDMLGHIEVKSLKMKGTLLFLGTIKIREVF